MKTISRAVMRGKPLDKDCKRAYISKHEYGPNDNRCFAMAFMLNGLIVKSMKNVLIAKHLSKMQNR